MYKVTEKALEGSLQGFPIEVVQKMVERQIEAGNPINVTVFQKDLCAAAASGGFSWAKTIEGECFWEDVICDKDFDRFFDKYPKPEEEYWVDPRGREMLVWNYDEELTKRALVVAKLPGKTPYPYVTALRGPHGGTDLLGGDEPYCHLLYKNAKPAPPRLELSLEQIAAAFGVKAEDISIKK